LLLCPCTIPDVDPHSCCKERELHRNEEEKKNTGREENCSKEENKKKKKRRTKTEEKGETRLKMRREGKERENKRKKATVAAPPVPSPSIEPTLDFHPPTVLIPNTSTNSYSDASLPLN
jgi:hypothetical protein